MPNKLFLQKLGFFSKDNANGIFYKKYQAAGDYCVEVDFEKEKFNFGNKIKFDSETTQNFSQEENWVVLECVNRLLEKGYKPEDIILEKTWKTGHGTSGRLDILVEKDKKPFLMIECKTWGAEFEKEFRKIYKDGGQLFTYFQQDSKADYLILYTSQFDGKEINYKNEIIKIEEHYRDAGNVKDFYDRWNKLTKQNGIFEDWVRSYYFESKAIIKKQLECLSETGSSFIFHEFLAILRKHSVSDKPNAFNRIFDLFLCKIFDEKKRETDELDFQWFYTNHGENGKFPEDNNIRFQVRLINLYKKGMREFLDKEVAGISKDDYRNENLTDKEIEEKIKERLIFNNILAIKEVIDDESFEDNAKVVKEVVELLSKYQIRYPRKQQHLSDFFERLLTTGLKQESGQFFTPPSVARFIIKSLPFKKMIGEKLENGDTTDLLPAVIDYAAGSGHFLTESMEETQKIIDKVDTKDFYPEVIKKIKTWKEDQFSWASKYIYGIEKDYRLVKVAKVGCYFYGDGLAQVIHGDGLDSFSQSKSYRGLLKQEKQNRDNPKFDFLISNPPYSVQRFRADIKNKSPKESFEIYDEFTDNSKEIECAFIERMKHLLKIGGCAGIILPSSILSNKGIGIKAREILLKYFEIIAITELGSGTFMATGTNTVVLFLRRRANDEWKNIENSLEIFFQNHKDITAGGIENIFSKYVKRIWGTISFEDFVSLCQNKPNEKIKEHNIYKEYNKKIKAKNDKEKQEKILEIEKEKLLYFILSFKQKVVIVKSGKKKEEKAFLGYEFSNRRGHEGIHAIQRSKSIDDCTKMYDPEKIENREKANYYIHKAFLGEVDLEIDKAMEKNVSYANLVDMIIFDRVDFEKMVSLTLKKTLEVKSKWDMVSLGDASIIDWGNTNLTKKIFRENGKYDVFSAKGKDGKADSFEQNGDAIILSAIGARCGKCFWATGKWTAIKNTIVIKAKESVLLKYLFLIINDEEFWYKSGKGQPFITLDSANNQKIPLPPKEIQEKIVSEIKELEDKEEKIHSQIFDAKNKIKKCLKLSSKSVSLKLGDIFTLEYGSALTEKDRINGEYPVMGSNGIVGYHNDFTVKGPTIIIGRKGSAGKVTWVDKNNFPIDTAFYVKKISDMADYRFIYYVLKDIDLEKMSLGTGVPGLNRNDVYDQSYDLPSLSEQQKIVAKIMEIEDAISKFKEELKNIKNEKSEVLKKYLY